MHQRRQIDRSTCQICNTMQNDGRSGGTNRELVCRDVHHAARCPGVLIRNLKRAHAQSHITQYQLRSGQWVPVSPKIQPPHQCRKRVCGMSEIQYTHPVRSLVTPKIAAHAEVLRGPFGRAAFQLLQHGRKALHPGGITFGVQAERRFIRQNVDHHLRQQIALVHAALDHVPADAMRRRAVDDRPRRRVQSGILRQWSIVKVDRTLAGQCKNRLRDQPQVGNAQQPVRLRGTRDQVACALQNLYALSFGPITHRRVACHYGAEFMPPSQDHVATGNGQGFIPHQDG